MNRIGSLEVVCGPMFAGDGVAVFQSESADGQARQRHGRAVLHARDILLIPFDVRSPGIVGIDDNAVDQFRGQARKAVTFSHDLLFDCRFIFGSHR
jgi:hypothetical protein